MEPYTLNPERFSLQHFYELTRSKKMIPSRVILQRGIEGYFETLGERGIENLKQLFQALGNKQKIKAASSETGIPEKYLLLLKREAGSYLSKPFPLSDFPGIPLEYTEVLKSKGIRSTRDFFESVQTDWQRKAVSRETGIPDSRLKEIYSLCDLSRIAGVGGFYARIIYLAGIRSLWNFAETDIGTHKKLYIEILDRYNYPVKTLGEDDLQYCISYARLLTQFSSNRPNQ